MMLPMISAVAVLRPNPADAVSACDGAAAGAPADSILVTCSAMPSLL
jgi:hypothetical protein